MTFEMMFVLLILGVMMLGLILEVARPDMVVFVALTIFLLTGVLTPEEALMGFSNQGMLTIALLFIIAGAVQKSGLVQQSTNALLGSGKSGQVTMLRMLFPVSGFSAFLNNTPIVITFTPIIRKWCADRGISPSKFLIPLSYATILGGMLTLMGTSTNLVVHGLMLDFGMEGFSIFQLAIVGVPAVILGILYIVTIGYRILPNHKVLTETVQTQAREYLSEMVVEPNYPYIDETIQNAGLRSLKGLYLIEIIRGNERISSVKSNTRIKSGDRLIFTGLISTIAELQQMKGLKLETESGLNLDTLKNGNTQLVEAVVSHQSALLYKKIRNTEFRGRYDAGVIAVHRNSERVNSKVGDITLKAGDTLLLLCGPDFQKRTSVTNDFYVVTPLNSPHLFESKTKGWVTLAAMLIGILLVTFNVLTMFKAMCLVVVTLLFTRIISPEEAKHSIQFNVLLLIAAAFGIGMAIVKSGTAEMVAEGIVSIGQPFGLLAVLILLYIVTNIFTEIITNSAAAVMMFPIAMEVALQMDVSSIALAVLVTIASSASFITPIGYQTNLIVYGPGGYRFLDYFKVGFPLSLIVMVITITMIHVVWIL